jgi:hypothetical protein
VTRPADRRPTLTLKGDEFSPEFRSLLNKAAKKAGKTQAAFAAEVLSSASRRVLSGNPDDTPQDSPSAPPPAVLAQIEDTQKRIEATDAKLDAATRSIEGLADQVKALTELQRKSLWSRIFGG